MNRKPPKWFWALCVQAVAVALLTVVAVYLSLVVPAPASAWAYSVAMWAAVPAVGAASAFFATRAGVSNYVAWLLPPICQTAAHYLLLGYPPSSAGMPFLTAGLGLVAAAAAQVLNERRAYRNSKKGGVK